MTKTQKIGTAQMLACSLLWSMAGIMFKYIPWNGVVIASLRAAIAGAVVLAFMRVRGMELSVSAKTIPTGIAKGLTCLLFVVANKMTTAANAIVLQFTAPVFVILLMAVIYRQKPTRTDILTCFAVLLGVVLFFVDGIRMGNLPGNVIAVVSGICYAGVFMMNTGKGADAISSCFLGQLAAGIVFTPLCLQESDFSAPVLSAVLAMGIIQVGGAYILFSIGIRHTPPVTASLITGMEPIMNPLLVAAFYGEAVSALSVVGSIIVVFSILAYNLRLARSRPEPSGEAA
jgi:drug/metabolite transporter (DMT)-like permease